MKTVILALLVLVVVSQGEALKCNCGGTYKICSGPVETCYGLSQVCARITFQPSGGRVSYMRGCMRASNCKAMSSSPVSSGRCCRTDRCN